MSRTAAFGALAAALLLAGCNQESGDLKEQKIPGLTELRKTVTTPGPDGAPVAEEGDRVYVYYEGTLPNGEFFDGNIDNPENTNPFTFILGQNMVIQGWDEGVKGMKRGEKATLEIPAAKAYGPAGSPPKIAPNTDLKFVVELIDVIKKGEDDIYDVELIKEGTGPVIKKGDSVTIDYEIRLLNGDLVDSSLERKKTETYEIGSGDVISGLDETLIGLRGGSHHKFKLPPSLAYGVGGRDGVPAGMIVFADVYIRAVNGQ
jgi:FKBP-type peptidyl-prolyl cis-trans isomerase